MAINSIREQILQYWIDKFEAGEDERTRSFKEIKRMLPNEAELLEFSGSQLPLLAMTGGLPVPEPLTSGRIQSVRRVFLSKLEVEFTCFAMDNVTPDSTLSDLADDIWVTLYANPTCGGLAIELDVIPEPVVGIWDPYVIFKMTCNIKYKHTIGGI